MIKAFFSLGFLFLFAFGAPLRAQQVSATDMAVEQAILDQHNTILLRQKIEDAKGHESRGDLVAAAKLYEDAYGLTQQIGSGIEAETARTVSGLVSVRMELARRAQRNGDYLEADAQVTRVLKVTPKNPDALAFKQKNDAVLESMKGKMPDVATLEKLPAITKDKQDAGTFVQDGKLLYESGKYEEAQNKLEQALKLDPDNQAAVYYLQLTKQAFYGREEQKRTTAAQDAMVQVAKAWSPKVGIGLPVPNPYATNTSIHTSASREKIYDKLAQIHLSVSWPDGLPLSEVMRNLSDQSKLRDPEQKGVNFLFNPNQESAAAAGNTPGGPVAVNPNTGLPPATASGGEAMDPASINIKLTLNDVSLQEALDAIALVADHPIRYSVGDYGVIFAVKPSGPEPAVLEMRVFKVDPNTFYQGLQGVTSFTFGSANNNSSGNGGSGGNNGGNSGGNNGGNSGGGNNGNSISGAIVPVVDVTGGSRNNGNGGGNQGNQGGRGSTGGNGGNGNGLSYITSVGNMQDVSVAAQAFFKAIGVDLTTPGRSIAFNDRLGLLFVKAAPGELDAIERTIQTLNQVAPQVHVKARFIEVSQDDSAALGFDWYLAQFRAGGNVKGIGGTLPSIPSPSPYYGFFPGTSPANSIPPAASDQLITGGLRNTGPTIATLAGIFTKAQFEVVLHALQQRSGVETLAEPEIVTTSGRQTQMRATDIQYILTGFSFQSGGSGAAATATTVPGNPGTSAITPNTQQFEIGPTLDVVPVVLSDGYTINLTLIPELLEFNQYDTVPSVPGFNPGTTSGTTGGGITTLPTVLPHFTVREVVTTVNIWDNQTVVLGGLISSSIGATKDKVPFLGDLPMVGRLFQSQSKVTSKKNLMVFVTATIVDPAGNRVHSDDELPFNPPTIVPEQPTETGATVIPQNPNSPVTTIVVTSAK